MDSEMATNALTVQGFEAQNRRASRLETGKTDELFCLVLFGEYRSHRPRIDLGDRYNISILGFICIKLTLAVILRHKTEPLGRRSADKKLDVVCFSDRAIYHRCGEGVSSVVNARHKNRLYR